MKTESILIQGDNFLEGRATETVVELSEDPDILLLDSLGVGGSDPTNGEVVPEVVRTAMTRYGNEDLGYNPKQPRDKSGKWTSGGGGGSSGTITATPESERMAAGIRAHAERVEPEITQRISEIVGDQDPTDYDMSGGGGQLYGFSHRLKAEDKIAEKIERVMAEKGYTREEAANDIKDAVRYTVHYPDDSFGNQAQNLVDVLRAENASVRVKNTWPPELGSAYKGINVSVTRHDGLRFEVQFHTPTSQAIKDRMHKLYEEQRVLPRDSSRWNEIEREMLKMGEEIPTPTGAMEVFTLLEMEPTQYFVARNSKGDISSVARWYLPESTRTEVNTGDGWRDADLLIDLTEDPDWEPVDGAVLGPQETA